MTSSRRAIVIALCVFGPLTAVLAARRLGRRADIADDGPSAAPAVETGPTPCDYVDPFIGTGGEGHTYPGATVPFGMVQLSPETDVRHFKESFPWAAGY